MARRRQAITTKHVAADAGVSLQTVGRVINGEPQLTAIDQPIAATFSKAVELLITERHSTVSEHPVVAKGSLVERGSTTPLATHARG
jgi:DNA-binding LacI/PurR family transcriptional regulator